MSERSNIQPRKWKLSDIGTLLKNSLLAVVHGKFLMRLKIDKYFVHIAYVFLLLALLILQSLGVETALTKVEQNKREIARLEILYSDKTFQVASRSRRSTVAKTLEGMGSKVQEPTAPATAIK